MKKIKFPVPTEEEEAKLLHQYLELRKIPHTHIGNESNGGTQAARIRGAKMKAMGQSKGAWDYEIFIPVKGVTKTIDAYQEVRIELKRRKGGSVSPEQKAWGRVYEKAGIPCFIAKGAGAAIDWIEAQQKEMEESCIDF